MNDERGMKDKLSSLHHSAFRVLFYPDHPVNSCLRLQVVSEVFLGALSGRRVPLIDVSPDKHLTSDFRHLEDYDCATQRQY